MNNFIDKLYDAFEKNGLSGILNDQSAEKLYQLYRYLIETNKTTNLTAITGENEVILKHFIDSASICKFIPEGVSVIDVGCGAGFPSLPIAILRKDLTVTSLDSTGKKIEFVKQIAATANLSNSFAVNARAEEYVSDHREHFDVCTSRAVARLNILTELCLPLTKVGGKFIAMKSSKGAEEFEEAKNCIKKLGGSASSIVKESFSFEKESIDREIYIISKDIKSPKEFPRKYSQILKRPL